MDLILYLGGDMIIYNMSNADKCYGEKQTGKCKREFRGARQVPFS